MKKEMIKDYRESNRKKKTKMTQINVCEKDN